MSECFCQSCGMRLYPQIQGTDRRGIPVEDYCLYCYKDGEFTSDVTMDEMIRLCSNYMEGNSRDVAIVNMKMHYPTLRRWARREDTQHRYYRSINRVLEYIRENLGETSDLKTLAGIANISPYHFHRIFKATIGESLAEYVQRLRLEFVAEQLKTSALSMVELADRTGYSSEQALSRAFRKYFGIPPKTFKTSFYKEMFGGGLKPRICKMAAKNLVMLRRDRPGGDNWPRLYMYAACKRLLGDSTESVGIIQGVTHYPALSIREPVPDDGLVENIALPEGVYAIFTHQGRVECLPDLFRAVNNYWLPESKYKLADSPSYVVYLTNASEIPPEKALSEVYVPVVDK